MRKYLVLDVATAMVLVLLDGFGSDCGQGVLPCTPRAFDAARGEPVGRRDFLSPLSRGCGHLREYASAHKHCATGRHRSRFWMCPGERSSAPFHPRRVTCSAILSRHHA